MNTWPIKSLFSILTQNLWELEVYQFVCNGTRVWYVDAGIEDTPEPGGAFLKMEVGIRKGAWQRA